jgi:hypothetical protein
MRYKHTIKLFLLKLKVKKEKTQATYGSPCLLFIFLFFNEDDVKKILHYFYYLFKMKIEI